MVLLWGYLAIAVAFFLSSLVELARIRARDQNGEDVADYLILHFVALVAALLWVLALPALGYAVVRRFRQVDARAWPWLAAWLQRHRSHLAD